MEAQTLEMLHIGYVPGGSSITTFVLGATESRSGKCHSSVACFFLFFLGMGHVPSTSNKVLRVGFEMDGWVGGWMDGGMNT
jgi:hypothetical protein